MISSTGGLDVSPERLVGELQTVRCGVLRIWHVLDGIGPGMTTAWHATARGYAPIERKI